MGRLEGVPGGADAQRSLRERFDAYLSRCSIKTAFILYSSAAVLAAALLSFLVAGVTSTLYADATAQQSRYAGAYLYDPQENALLPAISTPWYVGSGIASADGALSDEGIAGADSDAAFPLSSNPESVYFERMDADSEYYPTIYLDDLPAGFDMMSIVDMDVDPDFSGESPDALIDAAGTQKLSFEEIPEYDALSNAARGDVDSLRATLEAGGHTAQPHVSYVGYYVYLDESTWADAYIWVTVLAVPAVCVLCFALAARRFYRAKLERPIDSMGEAVRRVAAGDLDFELKMEDGGELGELGRSFESMRAELSRANHAMWRAAENRRRANTAFAHDLRTPLTVLSGRAEMLAEFAPTGALAADQIADLARSMQRQTARLTSYVESMRDLDALESFVPNPIDTDVSEWFSQEADDASDLARAKGLECVVVHPEAGVRCRLDVQAASRVAQNLIGNAIRHARSAVRISCFVCDGAIALRVADDGPGFSEEALAHAREPYWREGGEGASVDSERDGESHFGLGLNIASILCDKMGGSLALCNDPAGGGCAVATFPLT